MWSSIQEELADQPKPRKSVSRPAFASLLLDDTNYHLSDHCQPAISKIDLFVTVILNVLTDAYLLSIPIPVSLVQPDFRWEKSLLTEIQLLWRSRISAKEKTALIILFSGAIFVMMAGILRCALILTAGANGAQQAGSWAVRETFVAVVVSNLPIIYSLFRGIFKSLSEYSISIHKRSTANSSRPVGLEDLSDSRSRDRPVRSGRSRDPYPLTSSSLEHIVQEEDLESKSYDHRPAGPLSSTGLEGPGMDSGAPRIMVAKRTEVSSEDKSQAFGIGNNGTDGIYQCHIST